jgi:autotransporter adhesin
MTLEDNGARFSNAQTGAAVVVSGVAAGVAATDAANVGQMTAAIQAVVAPLDARLTNVEGNIQQVNQRVGDVESKLSGGIAIAMALTQPVSFAPGATSAITGGVATYNGQSALAFGFNKLVTNQLIVSGGGGITSSGQNAVRLGASFSW